MAQSSLGLPAPGTLIMSSPVYAPAIVTGIIVDPENPLQLGFIIDAGDDTLRDDDLQKEANKLINYFLATLTVPEDEMWVNLSPYEKDRIIAEGLGATEMGRDMLMQDYMLKQVTASLMYPQEELGEEFWKKVYEKSRAKFGNTEIPANTFNKVWIVPDEAAVYINGTNVFVNKSHLKVMLEEDYLAMESNRNSVKHGLGEMSKDDIDVLSDEVKEVLREIILPEIEREVNEGKNFANLRQIYHSMILATWYKKNLRESVLGSIYMDRNKIEGIALEDRQIKGQIYEQYLQAFKRGVYDFIRDEYDPASQEVVPRKYFSGGLEKVDSAMLSQNLRPSEDLVRRLESPSAKHVVGVDLRMVDSRGNVRTATDQTRRGFLGYLGKLGIVATGAYLGAGALSAQDPTDRTAARVAALRQQLGQRYDSAGFMVGGVNPVSAIMNLNNTGINGKSIADIEQTLSLAVVGRPGAGRSALNQMVTHGEYVINNGLTHQMLARPLLEAAVADIEGRQEFTHNGRNYRVERVQPEGKGMAPSAFGEDTLLFALEYQITDPQTNNTIVFSQGIMHYINAYGYYGAELTPQQLRDFFVPAIDYHQGNGPDQEVKMDYRRIMTEKEIELRINEILDDTGPVPGVGIFATQAGDGYFRFHVRALASPSVTYFTAGIAVHEGVLYVAHLDPDNNNAAQYLLIDAKGEEPIVDTNITADQLPEPVRVKFGLTTADQAMTARVTDDFTKGGIDFNPGMLDLTQQGQAINFVIDNTTLQNIQPDSVYGIQPVIIIIAPVTNILPLLGLTDEPADQRLSLLNHIR